MNGSFGIENSLNEGDLYLCTTIDSESYQNLLVRMRNLRGVRNTYHLRWILELRLSDLNS